MLMSMTGFAEANLRLPMQGETIACTIAIKTLNSRFLELTCKMPPFLQALEIECIKLCKTLLKRGTVTITIQMPNAAIIGTVSARLPLGKAYCDALLTLKEKLNLEGSLQVSDFLRIPDLFLVESSTIATTIQQQCLSHIEILLNTVRTMRLQEGTALQADLMERISAIQENMHVIIVCAKDVMQKRKESIHEKINALNQVHPDVAAITKASLYADLDKADLNEELVRMQKHLETMREHILSDDEEKGRRLDFILQEMNREINTIGAKCNDSTMSARVIDIKVELEKAREQANNIV